MPDSVYKVIELVGTSTESWEKAAANAIETAAAKQRICRRVAYSRTELRIFLPTERLPVLPAVGSTG